MPQGNKKRFESEYIECDKALEDLYGRGTYNGCAFLIPKKYFDECGGFDEDLRFAQDTLMWTKLLLSGCSIVYNGDVGVLSRVHANQQTNKSRHLLEHDSKKIADYIVPFLKERNRTSLFLFAKRNAKLSNYGAVQTCIEKGEITGKQKASLSLFLLYGKIRPTIRKVYYRIFKNIKTR